MCASRARTSTSAGRAAAARLGIEIVYQDLALADNLDVVANMFLGRERKSKGIILDEAAMEEEARTTLDSLSVTTLLCPSGGGRASGGQRQAVAVAKAVMWESKSSSSTSRPRPWAWPRPARSSTSPAGSRTGASPW